jgi:hypothetical protein
MLGKAKIPFIFLKGLPLHLYFGETHPRRIYADCDILIPKTALSKVDRAFKKCGYKKRNTALFDGLKMHEKNKPEISYYKSIHGFVVEFDVHLELVFMMTQTGRLNELYPSRLIASLSNRFIKEKLTISINGESFPIPSQDNLFVYLLLHAFHHNFSGAHRYDFITTVNKNHKLNFKQIAKVVNEYRLNNFVYPSLYILGKYYDFQFPKNFLNEIYPSKSVVEYTKRHVNLKEIVNNRNRISNGELRFINLFYFSPMPLTRKLEIFSNPLIARTIIWILMQKFHKVTYSIRISLISIWLPKANGR